CTLHPFPTRRSSDLKRYVRYGSSGTPSNSTSSTRSTPSSSKYVATCKFANTRRPTTSPRKPNPRNFNPTNSFDRALSTTSITCSPVSGTTTGLIGCGQIRWSSPYVTGPASNGSTNHPAFNIPISASVHNRNCSVNLRINGVSLNQFVSIGVSNVHSTSSNTPRASRFNFSNNSSVSKSRGKSSTGTACAAFSTTI